MDAEYLQELARYHDLELYVDQATAGSEILRKAGVRVSISIKREIEDADGRRISADAVQARAVRRSHEKSPFDALIYGSDMPVDFAWYEPRLHTIPRGVALGAGIAHEIRTVWEDRHLFTRLARQMWSLTGLVCSADFLISNVDPEAFGLIDDGHLPPWYTTGDSEPGQSATAPTGPWVAVAATSLGPRGAEKLIEQLVERISPAVGTTYLILTRPQIAHGSPLKKLLLQHCSESILSQIIVVATGDDGVAADFLARADTVVATSRAELAVPAVAAAARRCGVTFLDEQPTSGQPAGVFPADSLRRRGRSASAPAVRILTWEEPARAFQRVLEVGCLDISDDDLLVIHASGRAGPALQLFEMERVHGLDLIVWGRPDHLLGTPDPSDLYPWALAVRGAAVPSLKRAIGDCESIWDLICWAVSDEWLDRLRLLVLPAPAESDFWTVRDVTDQVAAPWYPHSGVLPPPRWIPAGSVDTGRTYPEPVYLPRHRFLPQPEVRAQVSVETWARRSRWTDRVRLAMPWKWGLLQRAMNGRWK